jgi:hypothetical protein
MYVMEIPSPQDKFRTHINFSVISKIIHHIIHFYPQGYYTINRDLDYLTPEGINVKNVKITHYILYTYPLPLSLTAPYHFNYTSLLTFLDHLICFDD